MLLSLLPLLACAPEPKEGDGPGECQGDGDEDGDGLFDCEDPDCAGALACQDADTDADADTDTDADTDSDTEPCRVHVEATSPEDGAIDAYYRDPIVFELSDADPTAAVSATVSGATTRSDDGTVLTFTPDAPLEPDTAYTIVLTGCFGSSELSFRTSSLGQPVADPVGLIGRTWPIDTVEWTVSEPAGIGAVLQSYLDGGPYLVTVTGLDGDNLELLLAASTDGRTPAQDLNVQTSAAPDADFSASPWFVIGPFDATSSFAGYRIPLMGVVLEGTLSADGATIGGLRVEGAMDTRPLDPLVSEREGAICDLAASFGTECAPCASDGEPFCLDMVSTAPDIEEVDVDVVVVEDGEPMCAASRPVLPWAWVPLLALLRRR